MEPEEQQETPLQFNWRKYLPYAPVAVFVIVVLAALSMDLAFSGPDNPKVQNSAPPPESVRATIEALPVTVTPYAPPPTATVTPGPTALPEYLAMLRDRTRMDDLAKIATALKQYHDAKGEYPSTGNNTQTLCVYKDIDAGCKLADYLGTIPVDPLGEPNSHGYWYRSDGKTYSLAAAVDVPTNATPLDCNQDLAKATGHSYLYCLTGS